MTIDVDEDRLDDAGTLDELDPQHMLRAAATAAAQIRMSRTASREAGLDQLADLGRPRAIVIAGMGGSGIAGDVVAAVAGPACPAPIVVHRGYSLPGWVGAADLVIAVSCSGATQETLSAMEEAARRGARVVGVGRADSSLSRRCEQARAPYVPVITQLCPRATLWGLTTPVLVAAARLRLLDLGPDDGALEDSAVRLEQIAEACHPDRDSLVNPGKSLAVELAGSLPMVWGAGPTGGVAATRMACQLAENAKYPAISGALPEAHHNQVVTLDGAFAGGAAEQDLFRDRVDDDDRPVRLRLVLLEDAGDDTGSDRAAASQAVAESRGVPVSRITAAGRTPLERLASMVGLIDFASIYLALLQGIDPSPVTPIDEVKARLTAD